MVSLTEKTTIRLPVAEIWPLLRDPALVASCIPGAELAPDQGNGIRLLISVMIDIDDLIPSRTYRRVHYGEA